MRDPGDPSLGDILCMNITIVVLSNAQTKTKLTLLKENIIICNIILYI